MMRMRCMRWLPAAVGVCALLALCAAVVPPAANAAEVTFVLRIENGHVPENMRLIRVKQNINDPEFASTIVSAFRSLLGRAGGRRRVAR